MNMSNEVGTLLFGLSVLYIIGYAINVTLLYLKARKVRTFSKGIKSLKFQTYNMTWQRYVKRYLKGGGTNFSKTVT
jgi:hypothetical protein